MGEINTQISIMQNTDVYTTDKCHYLLIHKNACSEIRNHLKTNSPFLDHLLITTPLQSPLPYWTTIRDPFDRFISGLSYDLYKSLGETFNLEKFLNKIDFSKLFLQKNPVQFKSKSNGNLNHTVSQWTYMFNQNLDFYVDIKDLDLFLDIHFPKRDNIRANTTPIEYKDFLLNYIEKNPNLKNLINLYLIPDYYLINQIYNSGLVWNWQDGKMF